ncbi:methionine--tRNA ligase [Candidatus Saccharibacteria bacterium]|nr:methionine--tRNA ligase [Candidatus Saccharibacteria bacterium]
MSNKFYVTTSIAYANGEPHLGFAMELLEADVLARYARQQGNEVVFSTGTDEHGTKIAQKAEELKQTPQQTTDKFSKAFVDLMKDLNISNDRFIRTTDKAHEQRAQIIWKAMKDDIYKDKYTGWYDVKQEEFVPEGQADPERMKPDHPQAYQKLEEENYFFKLSKYNDQIKKVLEDSTFRVVPKTRRNEVLALLNEGLQDISISRPKDKLSWGIPVPGDAKQVMYVWFEALMNYITVLGYPEHDDFKHFWPANVQVVGKDISRFHAAIWPAMLLSLNLPLPKMLYVHGFITRDGKAMSKSLGNGIAPKEVLDKYGVDPYRYYFLRHIPSYEDGDFSWEAFEDAYNNELANELGNAVQRTVVMIKKFQNGLIGDIPPGEHDVSQYQSALADCHFDRALDQVWERIRGLNQYIDEEKPWAIAKDGDMEHLREVLAQQASDLLQIADLLEPFMPDTAVKIRNIFSEGMIRPTESTLFPKAESDEE